MISPDLPVWTPPTCPWPSLTLPHRVCPLTSQGGVVSADGMFRSADNATATQLLIQVYDADVGVWGWLNRMARIAVAVFVFGGAGAFVMGLTDELTPKQIAAVGFGAAAVLVALVLSFFAAVIRNSDDDEIGEAVVPLSLLMDQRRHTLAVRLRPPANEEEKHRNDSGGVGIIRIRMEFSER